MRQEFGDLLVFVRGQTLQHIFEINVGIVPVESGALNQVHDCSCPLACPQGASRVGELLPHLWQPTSTVA
jgi:hypothetical protein